jgi:hypothetical protein
MRLRLPVLLLTLSGASGGDLHAQIKASEEATFSQTIDGTTISMRYARPSRRGRAVLFGDLMPWGERWTPGANVATTFRTDHDIHLDGHEIPTGSYSVWIDLRESGPWQLVLDPDTTLFHTEHPEDADSQIRFDVTPGTGQELETLLWSVDSVRASGGILRMRWGTTVVSMDLRVPMSQRVESTAEEAGAVTGVWDGTTETIPEVGLFESRFRLELRYATDTRLLTGEFSFPGGQSSDNASFSLIFLPVAEGIFTAGWGENGELWEVIPWFVEFERGDDGTFAAFKIRDSESDEKVMEARRVATPKKE